MKTNTNKKIAIKMIEILLLLVVVFAVILPPIVFATETTNLFDKTNVLDDLTSSSNFNINDYPYDSTGIIKHPEIMNVVEYCYSFKVNMQENYGLYLYFYNPQVLDIATDSKANKVQMAVEYKKDSKGNDVPTSYDKFDLEFCSVSVEPNYYKLFYKFKVVDKVGADNKKLVQRVNSNNRRYDISGVELCTKGNVNATEYTVGGTYNFTGFAKGYGPDLNAESSLKCDVQALETIKLDLAGKTDGVDKRTYWRSQSSSLGKNHQNQINSVFFAIDKSVLEKYGYILQKIKAEWWEYRPKPAIIVEDIDRYTALNALVGLDCPGVDFNRKYGISANYYGSGWGFNTWLVDNTNPVYASQLTMLFNSIGSSLSDFILSSKSIETYLNNYNKSYKNGFLEFNGHKYSADLFENTVDPGRTIGKNQRTFDISNASDFINLKDYDSTHNGWQKFLDYGFGKITTNEDFASVAPIQMITGDDMSQSNIADNLKINSDDVVRFKKYYNDNKKDKEIFIFRYAQTDYYASQGASFEYKILGDNKFDMINGHAVELRQGTQFFDFDILEFTFNKDGVYTVIPVVSSPIDHISAYTPAVTPDDNNWWEWLLLILGLIILLIILMPVMPYIIKLLVWIICSPFKLLAWIFRGFKKSNKHKKKE